MMCLHLAMLLALQLLAPTLVHRGSIVCACLRVCVRKCVGFVCVQPIRHVKNAQFY